MDSNGEFSDHRIDSANFHSSHQYQMKSNGQSHSENRELTRTTIATTDHDKIAVGANNDHIASIGSKPIKMSAPKVIFDDDDDDGSNDDRGGQKSHSTDRPGSGSHRQDNRKPLKHNSQSDHNSSSSGAHRSLDTDALHIEAREDLLSFLSSKGIDPKLAEGYKVHVGKIKSSDSRSRKSGQQPHSNGGGSGVRGELQRCTLTYSGPDGSMLTSKMDVLNDIKNERKRHHDVTSSSHSNSLVRKEAYSKAKVEVAHLSLPCKVITTQNKIATLIAEIALKLLFSILI